MIHFFYEDKFFYHIGDLLTFLNIDDPNKLRDDWEISVEISDMEPIFKLDVESMCKMLHDCNEERFPENPSVSLDKKIESAIEQAIDFNKLASLLPKFYYPSGKHMVIKKSDFINFFKPVA